MGRKDVVRDGLRGLRAWLGSGNERKWLQQRGSAFSRSSRLPPCGMITTARVGTLGTLGTSDTGRMVTGTGVTPPRQLPRPAPETEAGRPQLDWICHV